MKKSTPVPSVFLCHATEDKPAVRELYRQLLQRGITPWLDEEDLAPGDVWEDEIQNAVRTTPFVVVCLSKRSVSKEGFVQKEIKYALDVADGKPDGTTYIIPARLDDCPVPSRLSRWQWVNLFDAKGLDKLVRVIDAKMFKDLKNSSQLDMNACLLFSDGTGFSRDLMSLSIDAGFVTKEVSWPLFSLKQSDWENDFGNAGLVIITRGEHFEHGTPDGFYLMIRDFIAKGGFVFATPWVSWETEASGVLNDILPFEHSKALFSEDATVFLDDPLSGRQIRFRASFEHLGEIRENATLLLATRDKVPLLGIRRYHSGYCIYFNACEHSCRYDTVSPFHSNPKLRELIKQTLLDIHSEIAVRRNFPQTIEVPERQRPTHGEYDPGSIAGRLTRNTQAHAWTIRETFFPRWFKKNIQE